MKSKSRITTNGGRIPFPHPGATILEDYLKPLGMSVNRLALDLRVPATRIGDIVNGRRGISADTALRLARYFGTSERFWLNLQARYDLEREKDHLAGELDRIHPLASA